MTIAVIYGGKSGEHEISLVSAAAVTRNINKDNKIILIAITKEGKWYLQDEEELNRIKVDPSAKFIIKERVVYANTRCTVCAGLHYCSPWVT